MKGRVWHWLLLTIGTTLIAAALHMSANYAIFSGEAKAIGGFQASNVFMVSATIDIDPDSLEKRSRGQFVTAYIELPADYQVEHIDVKTVEICFDGKKGKGGREITIHGDDSGECEEAKSHPTEIGDYDGDGIPDLMVKFEREEVIEMVEDVEPPAIVTFIVRGLISPPGRTFEGTDTINLVDPEKPFPPKHSTASPTPTATAIATATSTSTPAATATPIPKKTPHATPEHPKKEGPRLSDDPSIP